MTTGNQLLTTAATQDGKPYVFGAEVRLDDPNPRAYDCSEFVQWVCARNGVTIADGAFNQWKACKRITVDEALRTPGALLFVGDGTGSGRDAITHVAFSRGDGTTWEARGAKWGTGSWSAKGRFDFAGLIPGVTYSNDDTEDAMTPDQENELKGRLDKLQTTLDDVWRKEVAGEEFNARIEKAIDALDDSKPGGLTKADVRAALADVLHSASA